MVGLKVSAQWWGFITYQIGACSVLAIILIGTGIPSPHQKSIQVRAAVPISDRFCMDRLDWLCGYTIQTTAVPTLIYLFILFIWVVSPIILFYAWVQYHQSICHSVSAFTSFFSRPAYYFHHFFFLIFYFYFLSPSYACAFFSTSFFFFFPVPCSLPPFHIFFLYICSRKAT